MERGSRGEVGRRTARCLLAVALFAAAGCADVGPVGVALEESYSILDADIGRRIPAFAGAPLPPGAVASTARVVRRHALRLIGARVRNGEIVQRGEVLGSLGRPGRPIPVSASAVPPSSPGLPAVTARDGDDEGCWYLVYYWTDTGEIYHVMLLSCRSGGGSEDEPECTEDQKAIAAEYDADGEWPCDKFDDTPVYGTGTHGHETGYLDPAYTSGRSAVWSYMAANHGVTGWINSDWRCPDGNEAVSGTGGSSHVTGRAGDFDAAGFNEAMHADFEDAAQRAQAAWWSGYGTGHQQYTGYIHIHW